MPEFHSFSCSISGEAMDDEEEEFKGFEPLGDVPSPAFSPVHKDAGK